MLKKVQVTELRPGMYVHELCGSWLETPFWSRSLMLDVQAKIDKIYAAGLREAWIDTDKGLDVLPAPVAPVAAAPEPVEQGFHFAPVQPVGMDDELGRAAKLVNKSRQAVVSMFTEARMGNVVNLASAAPLVEEIANSVMRNPGALIGLARLKEADDYTYMHSVAVCALMIALARQLGLSDEQVREAGVAGLLHDVGKMAIPLAILNKPGRLSAQEFTEVQGHPGAGHRMLLEAGGVSQMALEVCLHHHEKMDGSGYPDGLQGEQISQFARMGAICDVYDAITSNRPYKEGWCPADSLRQMAEWGRNGHFDQTMFAAFVKCLGIYPVGTLVRLKSERLGVVVEQSTKSLLMPKVRVFFSAKSKAYIAPLLLDLASPGERDQIAAREDAKKWGLDDVDRYWLGDAY